LKDKRPGAVLFAVEVSRNIALPLIFERYSEWQLSSRAGLRAVPEFICRFWSSEKWHFLEENAARPEWSLGTAILEPL
jgi:hypothetical protein